MAAPHAEATSRFSDTALHYLQNMELVESLAAIAPELFLAVTALVVVTFDMFLKKKNSYLNGTLALAGAGAAFLVALAQGASAPGGSVFLGSYITDGFTYFFRGFFLLSLVATLMISVLSKEIDSYRQGEYYAVLLIAVLSMCILVASGNLLIFILAFETMSLMSYVLVSYSKGTRQAAEASLKYLLYGALSSGVMVFGASYLYGLSGTIDLPDMISIAFSGEHTYVAFVALLMVLVGIGFKISMVPFHWWTPDVYQGAPIPIAAFLSVASKGAGIAVLLRIITPVVDLPALQEFARPSMSALHLNVAYLFGVVAIVTMTLGNFAALRQRDFKRLLAYSSIAQAGYMLLAFTNLNDSTMTGLLSYLSIYLFMNMGAFLIVTMMDNEKGTTNIDAFSGYGRTNPINAACLVMILVSLVGLPPMAGFFAKAQLFYGVIWFEDGTLSPWHLMLVLIAVLNTAVSLYYYIYPAKVMIIEGGDDDKATEPMRVGLSQWTLTFLLLFLMVAPLLYFSLKWGLMHDIVGLAFMATSTSGF
jgi:NADH-quinone oxidoreductase subunit N